MGGSPKVKSPPVPPPPPIPEVGPEVEDWAMKMAKKKRGFSKTIITGELVPMGTGRKTVLG